jgi:hypothetical protein
MTDSCSQDTRAQVNFKIKPSVIPLAAIKRLETYAHGSGGIGDIWKCAMSTQSGIRHVSLQTDRDRVIILLWFRSLSNPSGSHNQTTRNHYADQPRLVHEALVVLFVDRFAPLIRGFVAKLMFGFSCHMITSSLSRVSLMISGNFLH